MTADLFGPDPALAGGTRRLGAQALLLHGFALPWVDALWPALQVVIAQAPPRQLLTPGGQRMSAALSNCGAFGWVSDRRGYRYSAQDPDSGRPWPALPVSFLALARAAAAEAGFGGFVPDACVVNRYAVGARMGLHQDRDERDLSQPIVSVSLGLPAVFLWGGARRTDRAERMPLRHGDVLVWGGVDRLRFHGVAPVRTAVHALTGAVRFNLTFRRAGVKPVPTAPSIDWQRPWNAPLRRWGEPAAHAWAGGASVRAALNALAAAPRRFVAQDELPRGVAYEQFIFEQRAVPTRDNPHDFFNGLIWCALPWSKQRLNALQHAEIARSGVQGRRGPLRDALTVFDENAALLHAPDALWRALAERRWRELFGPLRPLWHEARLLLFGHAALEKLVVPYKSITVHVWRVALPFDPLGDLAALDAWLAQDLTPEKLAAKPFVPLPILGVPDWWPDNEAPGFYDDAAVFRPLRSRG